MILHFYLTRHFDDVIGLSKESIAAKTDKFNIDKPIENLTDDREPSLQQTASCKVVEKQDAG